MESENFDYGTAPSQGFTMPLGEEYGSNMDNGTDPDDTDTPRTSSWMGPILWGLCILLIIAGTVIFYVYSSKKDNVGYNAEDIEDEEVISDEVARKAAQDAYVKGYTYENKKKEETTESTNPTNTKPEDKIDTSKIKTSGKFTDNPLIEIIADMTISTLAEAIAKRTIPLLKKAAVPVAKFSLQARNILSLAKSVSKSRVAIKALAKRLIERVTKTAGKEAVDAVATKLASEVLETSLSKVSVKAGAELGSKVAVNAGVATTKAAVEIAETAGKVAAKTGIRGMFNLASLAKALKPSPMMLLTIFSIGLDIGDAGGYNKLQTVAGMMKLKDEVDKEMRKTFVQELKKVYEAAEKERKEKIAKGEIKEEDNPPIVFKESEVDIPPILNPINDMKEEDIDAFIDKTMERILDPKNNNALALPLWSALKKDLEDKVIKESDVEKVDGGYKIVNQDLLVRYASLLDSEELETYLYSELCKSKDGVLTAEGTCTYSKEKCHSLYPWPMPPPKKDKDGKEIDDPNAPSYSEFRDGKCQIASSYIRTTCDENKLKYNFETGVCEISKNYCESKGGEYRYNNEIKKYDCLIPAEQQVIEFLLGTTITRGLKQLFDPDQYESCGFDGEIKIREKCIDLPEGKTDFGIKPRTWDCNGSSAQKFFYDNRSRMIYSMKDYSKCFDTEGGTLNEGEKIILSKCEEKDSKQYIYDEQTKLMVARKDKTKCIGLNENKFASGGPSDAWKYTDNTNDSSCLKNWTYYESDGKTIIQKNISSITNPKGYHVWSIENGMMKNMSYGKCLSYDGNTTTSLENCDNLSVNQRWVYDADAKKIKHTSTGKFLNADNNSGKIQINTVGTSTDKKQLWNNTSDGQIISVSEQKCLASENDGKTLRLADCRTDDKRNWCATKRSTYPPSDVQFELVKCNAADKNQLFDLKRTDLRNLGLSCDYWRVGDCPSSYTNNGGTCGRGDSRIAVGAGRPADCPDGYENHGLLCSKSSGDGAGRVAECPKGYMNSGSRCEAKVFGRGGGWAKINGGISRCENGTDDISSKPGKDNCEGWGAYYYPKCQYLASKKGYAHADKWTNDACCLCSPQWGYKSFTFSEVAVCNDDEFLNKTLGRCYKKCPHGGTNTGFGTCTLGASHMKCKDDEFLNESLGRCYKKCPDGYTNTGVECYRPVSVLGASYIKCDDDFEVKGSGLFAGYCYPKKCPPGYMPKNSLSSSSGYNQSSGKTFMQYIKDEEKNNMYKARPNTDTSSCVKSKRRLVALSLDYNPENDDSIGMPPPAPKEDASKKNTPSYPSDFAPRYGPGYRG